MDRNETEKLARMFKILSAETRVRMLDLLGERTLCVNAMAKILEISPAAVSQHLRIMREAGLVVAEKRGYYVHYRIDETTVARWNELVGSLLKANGSSPPKGCKRKRSLH